MASATSTDERLIRVAIDHFGRLGLDGASTRAIAAAADTPMSSITYHFGGKHGLYLAAAEHIGSTLVARLGPAFTEARALYGDAADDAGAARASLHLVFARMVQVMVGEETAPFARFIVREQADPTEAFDRIYTGAMEGMLLRGAALIRVVSHDRLSEFEARLRAMTLFGQILFFRVARATVLAGTGWSAVGADETALIQAAITDNLDAIFDRLERGASS